MDEIITDLYVEVYWHLFRITRNEKIAAVIDLMLLSAFQLLNVYSIIAIVQHLLTVDFTGYLFHERLLVIGFCAVVVLLNFFAGRRAKKTLKKEGSEMFISRRFTSYAIISIVLFCVAHFFMK